MAKDLAIRADNDFNIDTGGMAAGLALLFNDRLYERCKDVARIMAGAKGITPAHLIGNSEACFSIVQMSITWKLTPVMVAASTYQTPGGKIGYEGKLVQAILENSGQLVGNVKYEMKGDWGKVRNKFKEATSTKGNKYHVANWKPEDEADLGVIASAQVKGEVEPRSTDVIYLNSCWPRNSTLWALRPEQQIKYLAARVLANTVMPGIFMGIPFDGDIDGEGMKDVTPQRPQPEGSSSFYGSKAVAEEVKVEGPAVITTNAEAWDAGIKANHNGDKMYSFPKSMPEELQEDFKGGWREAEEARTPDNRLEQDQNSAGMKSSQEPAEGEAGASSISDAPAEEPGPADAHAAGRAARAAGKPFRVPDDWKAHADAWQAGYDAEHAARRKMK
jgi:hypothetical protein